MSFNQHFYRRNARLAWIFGLVGILLTVSLLGYNIWYHRSNDLEKGERQIIALAEIVAADVERTLFGIDEILHGITLMVDAVPDNQIDRDEAMDATLRQHLSNRPFLMDLLVVDAGGLIRHWSGIGDPPDVHDRDYVTYHQRPSGQELFVGEPHLSRVHDGEWFFAASRAVRDDNQQLNWVVVAIIRVDYFLQNFQELYTGNGANIFLVSEAGLVYAKVPGMASAVGKRLAFETTPEQTSVITPAYAAEGSIDPRDVYYGVKGIGDLPIVAITSLSFEEILSVWRHDASLLLLVGVLVVSGLAVITFRLVGAFEEGEVMALELQHAATVDALTKLFNRRHFLERAENEYRRMLRYNSRIALIMMDVDFFKSINDQWGHEAGDRALRHVATIIERSIRESDIAARFGGEEFVVLLPETGGDGARSVAEKIRSNLETTPLVVGNDAISLTASFGYSAHFSEAGLEGLIRDADTALYEAKENGRNRIHAAPMPTPISSPS